MALSDEQRQGLEYADYARNVDFAGKAMITGLPGDTLLASTFPTGVKSVFQDNDNSLIVIYGTGVIGRWTISSSTLTSITSNSALANAQPTPVHVLRTWRIPVLNSTPYRYDGSSVAPAALSAPSAPTLQTDALRSVYSVELIDRSYSASNELFLKVAIAGTTSQQIVDALLSMNNELARLKIQAGGVLIDGVEYLTDNKAVETDDEYRLGSVTKNTTSNRIEIILKKYVGTSKSGSSSETYTNIGGTLYLPGAGFTRNSVGKAFYAVSLEFDGYQEGPLSAPVSVGVNSLDEALDVTLSGSVSGTRVTGINIYRAVAYAKGADKPDTPYYHIRYISGSGSYSVSFSDSFADLPHTYTDRTGLPETITSQDVRYNLAATDGTYLFAADCTIDGATDMHNTVIRSKAYRPDMFDWVNDFVRLEETPTALAFHLGNLFVWTKASLYVLSSDLTLVDRFPGLGVKNQRAVTTWSQGVAWASENGFWIYDGSKITDLGQYITSLPDHTVTSGSIETGAGREIKDVDPDNLILAYVPVASTVVLFGANTASGCWGWAYSIARKMLSLVEFPFSLPEAVVGGWTGNSYAVSSGSLYRLYSDYGSQRSYVWRSVDLARGLRTRIYEVTIERAAPSTTQPSVNIYYSAGGNLNKTSVDFGTGSGEVLNARLPTPIEGREIYVEVVDSSGTNHVTGITVRKRTLGR